MLIDADLFWFILIDVNWCWLILREARELHKTERPLDIRICHEWCLSCQKRFTLYFSSTCEVNTSHCYLAATSSTWEELGCNMQSTQVQKSSVQKMFGQKLQMCANMNMHICKIISTLLWLFDKLKEGKFTMEDGNPFVPLALVFTFFLHCGLFLLKLFK